MPLKKVDIKDERGMWKSVLIPEDASEEDAAEKGVPLGPPDLSELNLPEEFEVRLNNELFYRGVLIAGDALANRVNVQAAIQSALKLDTESVVTVYVGKDYRNANQEPSEDKPNTAVRNRRPRQSV